MNCHSPMFYYSQALMSLCSCLISIVSFGKTGEMDEGNTGAEKNVHSRRYGRVSRGKQKLLDWFSLPQESERLIYLSQYVPEPGKKV